MMNGVVQLYRIAWAASGAAGSLPVSFLEVYDIARGGPARGVGVRINGSMTRNEPWVPSE